jgi:hypothetical protein
MIVLNTEVEVDGLGPEGVVGGGWLFEVPDDGEVTGVEGRDELGVEVGVLTVGGVGVLEDDELEEDCGVVVGEDKLAAGGVSGEHQGGGEGKKMT